MGIIIDYEEFIIVKLEDGRYFVIEDNHGTHELCEVNLVGEDTAEKDIYDLLDTYLEFDYSGEALNEPKYLYFKSV